MSATNCRNSAPIPGFLRPSPSAASSTTSRAAVSAKSKTPNTQTLGKATVNNEAPNPPRIKQQTSSLQLPTTHYPLLTLFMYAKCMLDEKDFQRKADSVFVAGSEHAALEFLERGVGFSLEVKR